jgi:hypothetical protein
MGTLTETNPNARELVTEVLDETLWWSAIKLIVEFLQRKAFELVRVEFGFVLDRYNEGKEEPPTRVVQLSDLEHLINTGLDEGTIEWNGSSDFLFYPLGSELSFMLCNDADVHFACTDSSLLEELGLLLRSSGINVYDEGRLI